MKKLMLLMALLSASVYAADLDDIWGYDGSFWRDRNLTEAGILGNVVEDTTPQLGADLDTNGFNISFDNSTGLESSDGPLFIEFSNELNAVNYLTVINGVSGAGILLEANGTDTDIDLVLNGKGAGVVRIGASDFNVSNGNILVSGTVDGVDIAARDHYPTFDTNAQNICATGEVLYGGDDGCAAISAGGLSNVVEDLTPQLGGDLDTNGSNILFSAGNQIRDDNDLVLLDLISAGASSVNFPRIRNSISGVGVKLEAIGSDTDINLDLYGQGAGAVQVRSSDFTITTGDIDVSAGSITLSGTVDGVDVSARDHAPTVSGDIDHTGITNIGSNTHPALDMFMGFFNGTFAEGFDALVTSDGATVTMSIEQVGGGDLTTLFSSGQTTFDTTPAATIALTAGSDTTPTENFIYILESTGALTKSTTEWPSVEHIKVGYFSVPSAGFVQTNGVYVNQNWNDEQENASGQGHMAHMAERSRYDGAYYRSGVSGNGTDGYLTPTASNVEFKSTSGVIFQMHSQSVAAIDTSVSSLALVKNWNADAYHDITNLFDITADSTGTTINNNRYFNLTFWGVGNKGSEFEPIMINLPSGSYNSALDAQNDVSGYDDFSMPTEFGLNSSTGFLIARVTIKMNTTWTVENTTDLRGTTSSTAAGGATGTTTTFADNVFDIHNVTDVTKKIVFDAAGITTGTARTLTVQDASGIVAYSADIPTSGVDFDPVGTDNSTDVTIAAGLDYATIVGATQVITLGSIDLATDVTGVLSVALGGTNANNAASARTNLDVDQAGTDNSTDLTLAGTGTYLSLVEATQVLTQDPLTESDISDLGSYITASSTDTLTNKTFDANGTGNSLSNVDVTDLANGTDGELITWSAAGVAATVGVGTIDQVLTSNGAGVAPTFQDKDVHVMSYAFSDEATALTTGTAKLTFTSPDFAITLTDVYISVVTAPTVSGLTVDLNDDTVPVHTTNKLVIDTSGTDSKDAGTQPTISNASVAARSVMTIDIDAVGSTAAGGKLTLEYTID